MSAAARQRRPTVLPGTLTRDGYTSPAAVQIISYSFKAGGAAGMKAGPFSQKTMRNYPKLSWKSTTCDAWPTFLIDLNRVARGLANAFSPLTSSLKFQ